MRKTGARRELPVDTAGAVGGVAWRIMRFVVDRRLEQLKPPPQPSADYEHTKQLLRENEEMDEMLRKMRGEK